jgi:tetratricopeptide (TPR) repeat protein
LARPHAEALNQLKTLMRNEAAAYLELAVDYGNCGLYDEAILVLTRYVESADKPKTHPLACYYLGYYSAQKGDETKATEYYRMAALMSAEYCFPFQLECVDVLHDAMNRNPQDARAAYYLGNLLYDLQPERAVTLWEQSRQIDAKFATVHRNLGFAYARVQKDNGKAIASLEQAIACDARDPKFYAELDALYEAGNVDPQKRLALLEKNHAVVAQRDDGLLREITLHMLAGDYDRAIGLFEGHHFRLWEGEGGLHDIYADAYLLRGQTRFAAGQYAEAQKDYEAAMLYPESLETAKPTRGEGKLPQINYLLGIVYEATGQADKVRSAFQQATAGGRGEPSEISYYQGLAQRKLGQESKAIEIFDRLISTGQERLQAAADLDFFAKFGTRQSPAAQKARAYYLIGLGHLGKGQTAEANKAFEAALQVNVAHLGARKMLEGIRK